MNVKCPFTNHGEMHHSIRYVSWALHFGSYTFVKKSSIACLLPRVTVDFHAGRSDSVLQVVKLAYLLRVCRTLLIVPQTEVQGDLGGHVCDLATVDPTVYTDAIHNPVISSKLHVLVITCRL